MMTHFNRNSISSSVILLWGGKHDNIDVCLSPDGWFNHRYKGMWKGANEVEWEEKQNLAGIESCAAMVFMPVGYSRDRVYGLLLQRQVGATRGLYRRVGLGSARSDDFADHTRRLENLKSYLCPPKDEQWYEVMVGRKSIIAIS
jgi:hypothetical protein